MRIQNHLLYVLFLVSLTAHVQAQTTTSGPTFTQLSECRSHYQQTVAPGSTDLVAADTYCVSRMTAENYCTGRTAPPVNEVKSACLARVNQQNQVAQAAAIQEQQQAAILAAQNRQVQESQAARAAAATGTGTGTGGTGTAAAGGGGMSPEAARSMVDLLARGIDDARASDDSGRGSGGNSGSGRRNPSNLGGNRGGDAATADASAHEDLHERDARAETRNRNINRTVGPRVVTGDEQISDDAAMDAASEMPDAGLRQAGRDGASQTIASRNAAPPQTDITAAARRTNMNLEQLQRSAASAAGVGVGTCYVDTGRMMSEFNTKLQAYLKAKQSCTGMAEKAEFVCVEQSSPGARAVRTVLNLSGPAIAVMNSAQRACSSTSKVMDFASKLLTVAKGICVAAKVACDTMCTGVATKLTELQEVEVRMRAAATREQELCDAAASAVPVSGTAAAELPADTPLINAVLRPSQAALRNEANAADQGTTAGLVAKCEAKMVDIVALGGNILGMVTARNSAEGCEQQLAASGAGANVSVADFCEKPENTANQYCKCQRNSQQEGCPGFVAGSTGGNGSDGQSGTNIRNAAGLSNFAGAGAGTAAAGTGSGSGLDGASGSEGSLGSLSSLGSGSGSGAPPSVGGASASGSAGTGAAADSAAKAEDKDKDKKKWDFGSFASNVGSALGLGKGGSSGNGSLSSPKEEAIQRKVASEKLAGEISSASGKSNWEKVREQYLIKSNSLIFGQ